MEWESREGKVREARYICTLKLKGDGDLLLERWALMKKSAMFEEVFSVKFAIEE